MRPFGEGFYKTIISHFVRNLLSFKMVWGTRNFNFDRQNKRVRRRIEEAIREKRPLDGFEIDESYYEYAIKNRNLAAFAQIFRGGHTPSDDIIERAMNVTKFREFLTEYLHTDD